jgi:hypothetical protein
MRSSPCLAPDIVCATRCTLWMPTIRSLGTAFGAALGGMLASIGGLTSVTDPETVGSAITFVYGAMIVPMAVTVLFMVRLVRLTGRS